MDENLNNFSPSVENVELELESSYEHTKSIVGLELEVETQIFNLLWVSMMFWYLFDFMEKPEN